MLRRKNHSVIIVLAVVLTCGLLYGMIDRSSSSPGVGAVKYDKAVVLSAEIEESNTYGPQRGQNVQVRLTNGPDSGKTVEIYNNRMSTKPRDTDIILAPGDRIVLRSAPENGVTKYFYADFDRVPYIYVMAAVFIASLLYFGRMIGFKSLIGLGVSLVIFWQGFLALAIKSNFNIYLLAMVFCAVISLLVLVVVYGFSVKTQAAILGTWGGLIFAGLLSFLAIYFLHLTGYETEEAFLLKANVLPLLNFRGILFAGVIIGALGAIIDVTVSIASAQYEIYQSSPEISWRELYARGMNVGKDIMGAMTMTLVLAYVGSSMPLLLMIAVLKQVEFEMILNLPIVVSELVRALIGSVGLIYAIPLTALIMATILHYKRSVIQNKRGKKITNIDSVAIPHELTNS
ncbi:MAG: YibE/F family protein [Negativicutes bacterium]|nr:YibE/F family protein [Negativicutes bacterium]